MQFSPNLAWIAGFQREKYVIISMIDFSAVAIWGQCHAKYCYLRHWSRDKVVVAVIRPARSICAADAHRLRHVNTPFSAVLIHN
jgi:hypothetical protein